MGGQYGVKKVVTLSQSSTGQNSATFNFAHFDQNMNVLGTHASDWTPL